MNIHTLPMGSSSMGVITTGDVEDQQHNPNWFVNHKYMLRPNQEDDANKFKLGCTILKVPEMWRQPPPDFSPQVWHFGLHNRENLDCNGSEAIKLGLAVQYGLVGEKWDHFCDVIVDDPKAMLACYGLQNEVTNWTDEQIKHVLALDALLLATYTDLQFSKNERLLWTHEVLPSWSNAEATLYTYYRAWLWTVISDLGKVENQIPFTLIVKVVNYFSNSVASQTSESIDLIIDNSRYHQESLEGVVSQIIKKYSIDTSTAAFKTDIQLSLSDEKTHFLGAAYKVICGREDLLIQRSLVRKPYIRIPSATKLKQSGINIVGVDGPLCKMSYNQSCLYLPKVKIYTDTLAVIRNMVWYEKQSVLGGCLFADYYFLMTDLIQAREDWDLLVKCRVIHNNCRTTVFENWTVSLGNVPVFPSSQIHHEMKEAIVRRCDRRRYRLWSEFNTAFCSRPWLVLSTIAVVLVTMATLVQTYISVIGSNKMEPKFP